MSESPRWFQVGLPAHLTWGANPMFWRSAIVAESRRNEPSAFLGRNLMRPFRALHTQVGVALDLVLMLVDVPAERVTIAAFPSFLGPTVGAGHPVPNGEQLLAMRNGDPVPGQVKVIGGDPEARAAAAVAEDRVLNEFGLRTLELAGPQGDSWRVVVHEFDARADEVLNPDGHSLTQFGAEKLENLVRGTVSAASHWLLADVSAADALQVHVDPISPAAGPRLEESLAGESTGRSSASAPVQTQQAQILIRGSSQTGFVSNPTVKAYWNGALVGELKSLGGHLVFAIDKAGDLRLKCGLRSANIRVESTGGTVYLGWDRTWGRLVATRSPYMGA